MTYPQGPLICVDCHCCEAAFNKCCASFSCRTHWQLFVATFADCLDISEKFRTTFPYNLCFCWLCTLDCSNFCRMFRYWRKIRNFFTDMIYWKTTWFHTFKHLYRFLSHTPKNVTKPFLFNVSWSSTLASVAAFPFWQKGAKITEP